MLPQEAAGALARLASGIGPPSIITQVQNANCRNSPSSSYPDFLSIQQTMRTSNGWKGNARKKQTHFLKDRGLTIVSRSVGAGSTTDGSMRPKFAAGNSRRGPSARPEVVVEGSTCDAPAACAARSTTLRHIQSEYYQILWNSQY